MPELPEVETIKNQLRKQLLGLKIKKVEIFLDKLSNIKIADFEKLVANTEITKIDRRAKNLIIELDKRYYLLAHLKLTGRFIITNGDVEKSKFTQAIFWLSDGRKLFFDDVRKFGYIKFYSSKESLDDYFIKAKLGPEPLEDSFSEQMLAACLQAHKNKKIKQALLDQTCVAGLGNIYAIESLWQAKVMPTRVVSTLTKLETTNIYKAIKSILAKAVELRGSSIDDYVDANGEKGEYHKLLKIYGKDKKPCPRCKKLIHKMTLNGRGTQYCDHCQK